MGAEHSTHEEFRNSVLTFDGQDHKYRREGTIKMDLRKIVYEDVDYINLPENKARWRAPLNTVTKNYEGPRVRSRSERLSSCKKEPAPCS
jgi:hypothetical protein